MISNPVINEAITYILDHITDDITLDDLANHCHYSKFYFSRAFKAEVGESVYSYIKRKKMELSAFRMKTEPERSITDIGLQFGYSSSNFSSAFSKHTGKAPAKFKKQLQDTLWTHPYSHEAYELKPFHFLNSKIQIMDKPAYYVIYERFISSYCNMSRDWCYFTDKYAPYIDENTLLFERTYDDPTISNNERCNYDICMSIHPTVKSSIIKAQAQKGLPINTYIIPGGLYAVYPFEGSKNEIFATYQNIFSQWLPYVNYVIDNRYNYDLYHYVDPDEDYMEFDICIPIRKD